MTAGIDMAESAGGLGLSWYEPEQFPALADYECRGCGFIQGAEVIACSCGFTAATTGGLVSGVTTVTVVGEHVAVRRAR